LHDPLGVEGPAGSTAALGLLDCETELAAEKTLANVSGRIAGSGPEVRGYEIHMGVTRGAALERPAVVLEGGRADGARSADGQILGTYLHGLFDSPSALAALLEWAGVDGAQGVDFAARREADLDRLADALEAHLDLSKLATCLPHAAARALAVRTA
jgi:adenosylcobyric acid synthase